MELIDKAAVVAEIKRRINELKGNVWELGTHESHECGAFHDICLYEDIRSFLDTIEAKEVDLEKAARYYLLHEHLSPLSNILHQANLKTELQYHTDIENAFKAGFELGLKAAQKGE